MSDIGSPKQSSDLDANLEAEIEAALGDISLEDMVDLPDTPRLGKTSSGSPAPPPSAPARPQPRRGPSQRSQSQRERRTGTVINVHGKDVFVEFGPRSQGVCPLDNFDEMPKLGEQLEFIINRFDPDDSLYILSREGTVAKADWENLEVGQSVEARCTGVNKGGLDMEIANHKAFMPAGQVDLRHIDKLEVFIGEKMPCEILELNRRQGRIVLSRRLHLETERTHLRKKLLATLDVGQIHSAVITSIKPYGAFADLGGIDGLIHISDLSYERLKDPSQVVKEGDQVEVKVLKIDESQTPPRIGLGLKQLKADPYEESVGKLHVGDEISGKVTRLMQFGVFVEISPGVEGLIHISELSHSRISRPSHVVKVDEIITTKVLSIDEENKRISLSLKAMQEMAPARRHAGGGGESSKGGKSGRKGKEVDPSKFLRDEDAQLKKLKASLAAKFGDNLKGGLG